MVPSPILSLLVALALAGGPAPLSLSGRVVDPDGRPAAGADVLIAGVEAVVPVGDYRAGTVTLALDDPDGGPRWGYVFSDNGRRGRPTWHQVGKGGVTAIDPLGVLELSNGLEGDRPRVAAGDLTVRPGLYTADGLLIVTCYRGSPAVPGGDDGPSAGIALRGRDGRAITTARSGFA